MNTNSKALSCPICGRSSPLCAFGRGFWKQDQNVLQRLFSMLPVGGPEQPRRPAQPGRQGGDDGALMGVSGRYVSEAKAIQEKAPEKLEEVKAGTQRAICEEALQ